MTDERASFGLSRAICEKSVSSRIVDIGSPKERPIHEVKPWTLLLCITSMVKQTKWRVDGYARVISENEKYSDLDGMLVIFPTNFVRNRD